MCTHRCDEQVIRIVTGDKRRAFKRFIRWYMGINAIFNPHFHCETRVFAQQVANFRTEI